jgi:hypothetical protein
LITSVRAASNPPKSPDVMLLLMSLPFRALVEISNCDALN